MVYFTPFIKFILSFSKHYTGISSIIVRLRVITQFDWLRAIIDRIARSLLPVPIETLVNAHAYSDAEVIQ